MDGEEKMPYFHFKKMPIMSLNLQLKNQRSCANAGNHRSNSPSCLVVAVVLAS